MLEFTQNEAQDVEKTFLKHQSQPLHKVLKQKRRLSSHPTSKIIRWKFPPPGENPHIIIHRLIKYRVSRIVTAGIKLRPMQCLKIFHMRYMSVVLIITFRGIPPSVQARTYSWNMESASLLLGFQEQCFMWSTSLYSTHFNWNRFTSSGLPQSPPFRLQFFKSETHRNHYLKVLAWSISYCFEYFWLENSTNFLSSFNKALGCDLKIISYISFIYINLTSDSTIPVLDAT